MAFECKKCCEIEGKKLIKITQDYDTEDSYEMTKIIARDQDEVSWLVGVKRVVK